MEKVINTNQGGHILVTYVEICQPEPTPDENNVDTWKPYNHIRGATIYGVDAHSGRSVRLDLHLGDLNNLVRVVNEIKEQEYLSMTKEQYDEYVQE